MTLAIDWPFLKIMEDIEAKYLEENLLDYWKNEKNGVEHAIKAIAQQLSQNRFVYENIIGVGGSGIVIRLHDNMFPQIDKALKFPRPVEGKIAVIANMLEKEIDYLSELRSPGIVPIVRYDIIDRVETYNKLPFYLMEYINGASSKTYSRSPNITEQQFKKLVLTMATTVQYLHTRPGAHFAHLDIKHENVMVNTEGSAIIIDLGTCKRLCDEESVTIVMCTRPNAHPELVRRLVEDPSDNKRAKGELHRSEIKPSWDLWSFGLMLLYWMGIDWETGSILDNSIYNRLSSYTRKYYLLLAARLLSVSVRPWLTKRISLSSEFLSDFAINSAEELVECLYRLEGQCGPIANIMELHDLSSGSIQAAPGKHMPLTPALKELLEHRLYRRLNSVSQLSIVSQVFPGAKYSRREHSLGTYVNTAIFIRSLYNDMLSPLFRQIVSEEDCRSVLLASLVHDIGQFPLAHDLEEIDRKIFSHSELTQAMLKGKWDKKKRGSKVLDFPPFNQIFKAWKTTEERVIAILSARAGSTTSTRRDKLLRSIFSSSIDADKLDYLLRDALYTGVPYPLGIDVDRLQRCLTTIIINHGELKDIPFMGIHSKGKVAAEFLTLSRYAMFSQVYWHHAVRSQKAMLARAVGCLLCKLKTPEDIEAFKYDFIAMVSALPEILYQDQNTEPTLPLPEFSMKSKSDFTMLNYGTDLAPTDAMVLIWIKNYINDNKLPHSNLIEGILKRELFKRLWVISYDMDEGRWGRIVTEWDKLGRAEKDAVCLRFEQEISLHLSQGKVQSVTNMKAKDAIAIISEKTAGEIPWLLIDVPGDRSGSEIPLQYVLEGQGRRLRKNDEVVGALQVSQVWLKYAKDIRQSAGKLRIYCDPSLVDILDSSLKLEEGMEILEKVLNE